MECHEFREIADSYLGSELSIESNHEVISHLEQCSKCRKELSARRALRSQIREAFINAPTNRMRPEFANELSSRLRQAMLDAPSGSLSTGKSRFVHFPRAFWMAVAACLLLAVLIGLGLLRQRLSQPNPKSVSIGQNENNSPQIPISIVKTELAKSAVGDHRDCAVKFRLPERPTDLESAGRQYDPVYVNLTKAMFSEPKEAPLGAQFVEAHSCIFEGRRFAHIVLKYHEHLVSFLVTDIPANGEHATAAVNASTQPQVIVCSHIEGYQVSCFQTARHAIFVVSDLSEAENLALTRALAPAAFDHISHNERST
ncbi:MAG TPA: zf-HC2 domain-containing protein [Pyrinomonadaceae bacterium]|nr:zf-HC2 domain-containing protein [Pyrinomonadaceae bacterium]